MDKENEKDLKPVIARVEIPGTGHKKISEVMEDIILIKDKEQLDELKKSTKNSTILAIGIGNISKKIMEAIINEEKINENKIEIYTKSSCKYLKYGGLIYAENYTEGKKRKC